MDTNVTTVFINGYKPDALFYTMQLPDLCRWLVSSTQRWQQFFEKLVHFRKWVTVRLKIGTCTLVIRGAQTVLIKVITCF